VRREQWAHDGRLRQVRAHDRAQFDHGISLVADPEALSRFDPVPVDGSARFDIGRQVVVDGWGLPLGQVSRKRGPLDAISVATLGCSSSSTRAGWRDRIASRVTISPIHPAT
jgi:hypothetical protein